MDANNGGKLVTRDNVTLYGVSKFTTRYAHIVQIGTCYTLSRCYYHLPSSSGIVPAIRVSISEVDFCLRSRRDFV